MMLSAKRFAPLMFLSAFLSSACSYLPESYSVPTGVTVENLRSYIIIEPNSGSYSSTGFVFVPGGLVDPNAYVEAMSKVALEGPGYAVVIAKEPANLAVLNPTAAISATGKVPGVSTWVIGGHSLGGVMAAYDVYNSQSAFAGIVFEASYPQASKGLSSWSGKVLSLYAEHDGLAPPSDIAKYKSLLPASTDYEEIAGGCHAYFGSYGDQSGDGSPTITRDSQQTQAAAKIAAFLAGIGS